MEIMLITTINSIKVNPLLLSLNELRLALGALVFLKYPAGERAMREKLARISREREYPKESHIFLNKLKSIYIVIYG